MTTEADDGWALADALVLAAVEQQVLGESRDPVQLGKYRVVRMVGAGAMGRVLLAEDPSLDRRVALKLIAPELADDPKARARIEREARAMARLSDPHVAQVYEVAQDGEQLFVAMEFVDGDDLRTWLDAQPRAHGEILDVFRQAGLGLWAAHEKGIVHRDFKPENVMLDAQGRARVVDFGLALPSMAGEDTASAVAGDVSSAGPQGLQLSVTGAWLGTPAYMAPEQWDGGVVDARSDQFAFCVALFEALVGQRPFAGDTAAAVRVAIDRGVVLPASARLSRRVEAALRRGLLTDPADRWPTMEPLLRALAPRSRTWVMGVASAVAVAGAAAVVVTSGPAEDPCAQAGAPIDAVWGQTQRAAVVSALEGVEAAWAERSAAIAVAGLDETTAAWREAARAVCSSEASVPAMGHCLDHSRRRIEHWSQQLGTADPAVLVGAAAHVELLADPRACLQDSAIEWLDAVDDHDALVAGDEGWAHYAEAERSLGALSVHEGTERYLAALQRGRAAASEALAQAERTADQPLAAHATWLDGRLALRDGDLEHAEARLREAMQLAAQVHAPALRTAAAIDLVYLVGKDADRDAEAYALADDAASTLAALGDPPLWTAHLATHRASAIAHASRPDRRKAEAQHRRALELLREHLGPQHPDVIVALGNLGSGLVSVRPAEAEAHLREAVQRARSVWGPSHPRTARLLGTLGLALMHAEQLEAAEALLRESLAVRVAALGEEHDEVASARHNLALALRREGKHAEAVDQLRQGLAVRRKHRGPDDPGLVSWLLMIGVSELTLERLADAQVTLQEGIDLCELRGASINRFATLRFALARAYAPSDPAKARVLAELARRAWDVEPQAQQTVDEFIAALPYGHAPKPGPPSVPR